MKSPSVILLAAAFVCYGPAAAQTGIPRALEFQPSERATSVVHDGIVFYRAVRVDATLVPEGQVLTAEGRLVTLPTDFVNDASPTVREGLFAVRGQAYLIRNGRLMRVDAVLVPEGQVLTTEGRYMPLPSDFSGFVHDRAPDGRVLPIPPLQAGDQTLMGQVSVPQPPTANPQGRERGPLPPSLEVPRVVVTPVVVEVRPALPAPMNLLPPALPFKKAP
jgi:hypothetical protein